MQKSNFHTHSVFSDGHNTPEEMVEEALSRGFTALGFSDHSYTKVQEDCCMLPGVELKQYEEIQRLKRIYADRINLYAGIELDYVSDMPSIGYDYMIGSVHEMSNGTVSEAIDNGSALQQKIIDEWYGGDTTKFSEDYFKMCVDNAYRHRPDIIGHFDLVTKYSLVDENRERYRDAAFDAIRAIVKVCPTFEMNTGAIARGYRTVPYPADFMIDEIYRLGGRFVISSDCHYKEKLTVGFEAAEELLLKHGFRKNENGELNSVVRGIEIWEK